MSVRIKEAMPLSRTGVQKQCSGLIEASKLVLLSGLVPAYFKMVLAFLCADILSHIWEKIDWELQTMPTWSVD